MQKVRIDDDCYCLVSTVEISDNLRRVYHPGIYPDHSGQLSLAIPPWVAMSTGDGFGHIWEETAPLKLRPYGAL